MKRKIRPFIAVGVLACAAALAACSPVTSEEGTGRITYFRDNRTGLCFATARTIYGQAATLTHVPCTPEVLAVLQ